MATVPQDSDLKIVEDATCTFCGCVCDDIDLTVEGDKIVAAKRACVLGKAWFLNHEIEDRPSCKEALLEFLQGHARYTLLGLRPNSQSTTHPSQGLYRY